MNEREQLTELQRTAPERIWLQFSDDAEDSAKPYPGAFDVTWCDESVVSCEVEYVRADLARAALSASPVPARWTVEMGTAGTDQRFATVSHVEDGCQEDVWRDEQPLIYSFLSALAAPSAPAQQDHPECSGDPTCCPENEGYGCCKPNHTMLNGLTESETLATASVAGLSAPAQQVDAYTPEFLERVRLLAGRLRGTDWCKPDLRAAATLLEEFYLTATAAPAPSVEAQAPAQGAETYECTASGRGCSFGAHGPKGERQCEYCGEAPSVEAPAQQADGKHEQFEAWWEREGQYCRAGGGDYEKSFAFAAWLAGPKGGAPSVEAQVDEVQVFGVRSDGTQEALGFATMPPKMKAREIVRDMFGEPDEERENDAAYALWCCERLIDWMAANPQQFRALKEPQQ